VLASFRARYISLNYSKTQLSDLILESSIFQNCRTTSAVDGDNAHNTQSHESHEDASDKA
jgi:hypothetical protein